MKIGSPGSGNKPAAPKPISPAKKGRGVSPIRDMVAVIWLIVLIFVVMFHEQILSSDWLAIHVTFLGALSHSALVWSEYFANTLLKTRPTANEGKIQDRRSLLMALGALFVFVGFPMDVWVLVLIGATFVTVSVLWHAVYLARKMKRALPGRFRIVIRYYITAACMLPVGAAFGVLLAFGFGDEWRGRLMIAHMTFNLLGWIGLTVIGTLVTFWPTMVRARMDERSERMTRQVLWPLLAGIVIVAGGAVAGIKLISIIGVAVYALSIVWWGRTLWKPVSLKGIREFAPASVGAAGTWAVVGLIWIGVLLALSDSWPEVTDRLVSMAPLLAFGFALQILLGALSYLLPVLMGKSPANLAVYQDALNVGATFRIAVPNLCLVIWLLPVPSSIRLIVAILGIGTIMSFIPIMFRAVFLGLKHKKVLEAEREVKAAEKAAEAVAKQEDEKAQLNERHQQPVSDKNSESGSDMNRAGSTRTTNGTSDKENDV